MSLSPSRRNGFLLQFSLDYWVTRSTFRFRSEIPTHVSWSADGSLFAVSMGPHVAIYDGQTNVLYQVMTSPECKHVSSAHFIGPSGRYVTVMGSRDVMLWDMVSRSSRSSSFKHSDLHSCVIIQCDGTTILRHHWTDCLCILERSYLPSLSGLLFRTLSPCPRGFSCFAVHLRFQQRRGQYHFAFTM